MSRNSVEKLRITVLAEDSVLYESPCLGQHGISLFIETESGGQTFRCLVDVGQNPQALLHNANMLDIPMQSLDALFLTHCHYDHTQGTARILSAIGKKSLPVYAHPEIFRPHFVAGKPEEPVGVPLEDGPEHLEAAGGRLCLIDSPLEIAPGIWSTGEIPRLTSFEVPPPDLRTLSGGRSIPDPMRDDISLAINHQDRGTIVISGCSHAGIVNICRRSMDIIGELPLEGVVGGLHLVEAGDETIGQTVTGLVELSPRWLAPGHCTGFPAMCALRAAFGERLTPLSTGERFEAGLYGLKILS